MEESRIETPETLHAAMTHTYDRIGIGYEATRRADPRIAALIDAALGDAASVINVGAGTGSYEPERRTVAAIEPSRVMIRQRPPDSAPALQAAAEHLPLRDGACDAALAVLTIHHWANRRRGLAEMRRVAHRRVVILTWDARVFHGFWLVRDYFPCIADIDRPRAIPIAEIADAICATRIVPVPVPHDCSDGFLGAFWRRPQAYLDPRVRAGTSVFPVMSPDDRDAGLGRLAADLESGAWARDHADLLALDELDLGYRLIVAESPARVSSPIHGDEDPTCDAP